MSSVHAAPVYQPGFFSSIGGQADADFNAFYGGQGTSFENFGGEGRFGNNSLATGQYEYNINRRDTSGTFVFGVATGQNVWNNSTTAGTAFVLTYSGDDFGRTATWGVQGRPNLSLTSNFGDVERLMVRARAGANQTLRVQFASLTYTDTNQTFAAPGLASALAQGTETTFAQDYLSVTGFDFTRPWRLEGSAFFAWPTPGAAPGASAMSFQIKAMQRSPLAPQVPEPGTAGLLAAALVGIGVTNRVRRRAKPA